MRGRYDTFLHTDPDFNTISVAAAPVLGVFGTGTGSQLVFQLVATYQQSGGPGQAEIIQNLNGTPILYDNGTTISAANYTIGATGIVTFGAGHAAGLEAGDTTPVTGRGPFTTAAALTRTPMTSSATT